MDYSLDSVYDLITKLCEKYSTLRQNSSSYNENIKTSRRRCYEILLSKSTHLVEPLELENNEDPVCHLLAWEYTLKSEYNLIEHAKKIRSCCEKLEKLNVFNDPINNNIIMFLLNIRSLPTSDNSIMETTLNKDLDGKLNKPCLFPFFDDCKFRLSDDEVLHGVPAFENDLFKMNNRRVVFKSSLYENGANFINSRTNAPKIKEREEIEPSSTENLSIWEIALSEPLGSYRTWEEFGFSEPEKELPFLCESGPESTTWVFNLSSLLERWINANTTQSIRNVLNPRRFIRDIKYLLVGIETKTFICKDDDISIEPGTCLEGLTPAALKSYSEDLIFCGRCYKGLDALCSQNPFTLKESNNGYIFFELCESIKRYLSYYRLAVLSISNSVNLLMVHQYTKHLRTYVTVLASICKVGPYKESTQIPHGVALLNYLFHQVMSLTDTNVIMVLYSILYPCCQVYFSRFLQQWLLDGTIHDPYGEFFINVHSKYVTTRGRTYWSRSYSLREDIVPDFIENLSADILLCGKAMNLLKLCVPNSPLCLYLMERRPEIISCCVMAEQLSVAEYNNYSYYLEATAVCGPRISLSQIVTSSKERNGTYLNLIAKKRVATLNRIELERRKESEKKIEKRQSEMKLLQEEYDAAIRRKELKRAEELDGNIKTAEKNIWMENLHDKIVQEESNNLIEYYNQLFQAAESRRLHFEKRAEHIRTLLDHKHQSSTKYLHQNSDIENTCDKKSVSVESETSLSVHDEVVESNSDYVLARSTITLSNHSSEVSLDDINANSVNITEADTESTENEYHSTVSQAIENFEIAKRNKAKVLSVEMDIIQTPTTDKKQIVHFDNSHLTDAQKNKLKVMSSEFGIDLSHVRNYNLNMPLSTLEINRNRVMTSSDCFSEIKTDYINEQAKIINDNENFLNKNVVEVSNFINDSHQNDNGTKKWVSRKQDKLSLDFSKIENSKNDSTLMKVLIKNDIKLCKSPKFELEKVSPMSIDSTPLSSNGTTPSNKLTVSFERNDTDVQSCSEIATATEIPTDTSPVDQGFNFEVNKSESVLYFENRKSAYNLHTHFENRVLKKNISNKDAKAVSTNCLKLYLQQSISIPLTAQIKLVTNELLKFFINDQQYLKHLHSLRNYFFLLDGEFGRNITENLFKKLYDVNFPMELVNIHTLTVLVYKALDYSTKLQDHSQCLSFRINNLPQVFDLGDPDVFDCISLTYKTFWPLNILLPSDTVAKYDEVFKFLLKLHRISWVLQNVFQDLKSLLKETETKKFVLMMSPQYRRLHQCRHIMMHFIQTLQSYILGEVLYSSWEIFENHLKSVTNIDQLYMLHTSYIKNILFMCLLNQKSAPLQKVLHKIFIVILKFYDYLRSRSWYSIKGVFLHPNFKKLEDIFDNFQDLVFFLFKIGHKVVRSGYQPHLLQLLNMLDVNDYYSKKNNVIVKLLT